MASKHWGRPAERTIPEPVPDAPENSDRTPPTREDMETDVSIPAGFDEVMQAVIDGYGTQPRHTTQTS